MVGGDDVQGSRPHAKEIKSIVGALRCARTSIVGSLVIGTYSYIHTNVMCHFIPLTEALAAVSTQTDTIAKEWSCSFII